MNLTSLARPFFERRYQQIIQNTQRVEDVQRSVLTRLLRQAAHTAWGRKYHYDQLHTYEDFAATVPVSTYEDLKAFIDRMRHGEADLLCKGRVNGMPNRRARPTTRANSFPSASRGCTTPTTPAAATPWPSICTTIRRAASSMARR